MPKKPAASELDQSIKSHIGARIRMVCASSGAKPADIASIAGVSLAHQYRIEAGERTPDALYLIKVARHLGVSLDALCGVDAALGRGAGAAIEAKKEHEQARHEEALGLMRDALNVAQSRRRSTKQTEDLGGIGGIQIGLQTGGKNTIKNLGK